MYAVDGIAARDKKIDKIDFIEDCDDEGNTSLHYAVQNGKRRVKYRRPTRYKSKSITRWGGGGACSTERQATGNAHRTH